MEENNNEELKETSGEVEEVKTETVVEETTVEEAVTPPTGEEVKVEAPKKKSKAPIIIPIVITIIIAIGIAVIFITNSGKKADDNGGGKEETKAIQYSEYAMKDNTLSKFDLAFLKQENIVGNKIYSPLSIKYALAMLSEGSKGDSKTQIDSVIGKYSSKKYTNSNNLSLANALFIQENNKDGILSAYVDSLKENYNAEVVYDSFATPDAINSWVKDKTFHLIDNLVDDVSDKVFVLVNALAIDMEWVNKIQAEYDEYSVNFDHEDFYAYVPELNSNGFSSITFDTGSKEMKAEGLLISAVANKYDIVTEIGEESIRKTVGEKYREWLKEGFCEDPIANPTDEMVNSYLDKYVKEINTGYKHISSSTDFLFANDDNYIAFAKDLKTYDGTTLQYIAIMPKTTNLLDFVLNSDETKINSIIGSLKDISLDSFEDGYITKISGKIPTFKFEYELKLMDDLKAIGIKDVFDSNKADLSGISGEKGLFIDEAAHKATIEFSNDGIKAGAATSLGGKGNAECKFDYKYEVPVKEIELNFDNPYLFLIRDKDTQEVWFIGTVYEPNEYKDPFVDL